MMKGIYPFFLNRPVQDAVRFKHPSSQTERMIQFIIRNILEKDQYDGIQTLFNSLLNCVVHLEPKLKKITELRYISIYSF